MSHQGGYAVVDVDDDGTTNGQGLEFKSEPCSLAPISLPDEAAFLSADQGSRPAQPERPADAPYNPFNIAYYQVSRLTVNRTLIVVIL